MAKKTKVSKVTRKATSKAAKVTRKVTRKVTTKSPATTTVRHSSGPDRDPTDITSKEVIVVSETAGQVARGLSDTVAASERVAQRWAERQVRDGVTQYYSPFDARDGRKMHSSVRACNTYIKKYQKNRLEQAKLTGEPHEPVPYTVSPKRTLADFVDPKTARFQMAANDVTVGVVGMTRKIVSSSAGKTPVSRLISIPETMAIAEVKTLGDDDLIELHQKAGTFGKRDLAREARKEMKIRDLPVTFR